MRRKKLSNIPDWFDLSKYSICEKLTLAQWSINLDARLAYTYTENERRALGVRAKIWREDAVSFDSPIKLDLPDESFHQNSRQWRSADSKTDYPGQRELETDTVRPLKAHYIVDMMTEVMEGNSEFGKRLRAAAEAEYEDANNDHDFDERCEHLQMQEKRTQEINSNMLDLIRFENCSADHLEHELDYRISEDFHVSVDLSATDEMIVRNFKAWLKATRKLYQVKTKTQFTDSDMMDWAKYALMPYVDLRIWSLEENIQIPDRLIGDALFPEDTKEDVVERIRKVVRPKADWIMGHDILSALRKQAFPVE